MVLKENQIDKKFGYLVFGGAVIGAVFGMIWAGAGNPMAGLAGGALVGAFIGWFVAAYAMEKKQKRLLNEAKKENRMDKTTKTVLIIIGSLLVVCACTTVALVGTGAWSIGRLVQFADNSTTENPREVAQIASGIAAFDVPEGFYKQYGMQIGGWSLVQYMTGDENTILFVTQFPADTSINLEEMIRQIKRNSHNPNSPWYNVDTELVEQTPVTIRGQETTLNIHEGTTREGVYYRMANAEFQGNGEGPALFLIAGPADQWDTQLVEDFIESIQ